MDKMDDHTLERQHWHTAVAPSNIAFVKYWGKRDEARQWPANDSLSMTLSACRTETSTRRSDQAFDSFTLAGELLTSISHPDHKIIKHIDRVRTRLGIRGYFEIQSHNTFPSACGIASSASGFAALTLSIAAAASGQSCWEDLINHYDFGILSDLARLGSGSAMRSLSEGFVIWRSGDHPQGQSSVSLWSKDHWDLVDVIVVFSDQKKTMSSSEAHRAVWSSPLFPARIAGISERMKAVTIAIKNKDIALLGREIEAEALDMHAVAMTGHPTVNYINPETADFLRWVRIKRADGNFFAWFTMDAGPNVHLICERRHAEMVISTINNSFPHRTLIIDSIGSGPILSVKKSTQQPTQQPARLPQGVQ